MIANIGLTWKCPACCDFHGRGSALGVAEKNQEVQTLKTPIGSEWPMHNKSAQGHQDPATDLYRRLLSLVHWFASCRASGTVTYSAGEGQSCHADLASMLKNLCVVLLPTLWPANSAMAAVFFRPSPLEIYTVVTAPAPEDLLALIYQQKPNCIYIIGPSL